MAWEWLEKYLKGSMVQPNAPDVIAGAATEPRQGLFGTGGNFGKGGLLTTFNQNPNAANNMFEMLSNPAVGIGASIVTRGMKGEDIGTSAFPAVKEGITFSEGISKINTARKQREFIKKYESQVPEGDLVLFRAFPVKYVSAMLSERMKKTTLGDRATEIFDKIAQLPPDKQAAAINKLPKIEQDLYKKYIRQQFNLVEEILSGDLKSGDGGVKTSWEVGDEITTKDGRKARVTKVDENGKILDVERLN